MQKTIKFNVNPEYMRMMFALAKNTTRKSFENISDDEVLADCLTLVLKPYGVSDIQLIEEK